jgi:hypothetical protein
VVSAGVGSVVRDLASRGALAGGATVVGTPRTLRARGGRHAKFVGAAVVNAIVTAAALAPAVLDTTCDATGEVALQTNRVPSGDHVGLAMSPWLALAIGTTELPLGCVTTRRPCPSMMARRPGNGGSAPAALSAGRVVVAVVLVAPGRVVVVADERVVLAPVPRVVVVEVDEPSGRVVVPARVVVDARAAAGLRS